MEIYTYNVIPNQKKIRVALLIIVKAEFRARENTRDKETHCIMIKGSILLEDIAILNAYASNNRTSKHMRQKLQELQGERDKSAIIVGDFSTPPH